MVQASSGLHVARWTLCLLVVVVSFWFITLYNFNSPSTVSYYPPPTKSNAEELIQVVLDTHDQMNQYQPRLPIDLVHKQAFPHRGTITLVLNSLDQVLILQRSLQMRTCPGTWSLVGEHSQPMEEYVDTAVRGLKEELNISDAKVLPLWRSPRHLYILYNNGRIDNQWTMFFYYRLPSEHQHLKTCAESSDMRFVPLDQFNSSLLECPNMLEFDVAEVLSPLEYRRTTYPALIGELVDSLRTIVHAA
eukprot:CAMPEP_0114245724 /NCGR_PEP_ID=MMETSP0058-20121206/12060_1 /TAXON_ID=36894 /ORGANISM="Pyramimonas parkeae, CCMP726" /LENGTH=246 /DNA_ID=CAMNT_0001358819 /DNA_START=92 /DNA_END=832 /DNA_ORIENTATION=+